MIWFNDRFRKNQKGQTLVEFALILPIIIIILFGITEFGRAFYSYIVITNAAREGARAGVVGKSNDDILARVKETAPLNPPLEDSDITITPSDKSARTPGVSMNVEVTYDVDIITPVISNVLGKNTFTLTSKAVMRVE